MWRKQIPVHCWWELIDMAIMEKLWSFLKKLKIELPYDQVIPLLDIYTNKTKALIWICIYTPMLIAALFTIAKIWKQPKFLSIDEWLMKNCYTYKMEYYSAIEKNKNLPLGQHKWTLKNILFKT